MEARHCENWVREIRVPSGKLFFSQIISNSRKRGGAFAYLSSIFPFISRFKLRLAEVGADGFRRSLLVDNSDHVPAYSLNREASISFHVSSMTESPEIELTA